MYPDKYDGAVETKKESVVEREISQLGKATSELNALAEDLQNRLNSVLRNVPEGKEAGTTTQETLTALPSAIREQYYSVGRAAHILQSILSRLEL
mgnify:FL=1